MKNLWKFIAAGAGVFVLVVLFGLFAAPMIRGASNYGFHPMWSGTRMIFGGIRFLFNLVVLAGLAFLVYYAIRSYQNSKKNEQKIESNPCVSCGKFIQKDWKVCPYCATPQNPEIQE